MIKSTDSHGKCHLPCAGKPPQVRGFTLIELLVVLVILGLLAGLVGPQVMRYLGESKTKTAGLQIKDLGAALDLYRIDTGSYPSSAQGLEALVNEPSGAANWNGPYLRSRELPLDPWGREYSYRFPGDHGEFDLWTNGADGRPGGEGDNKPVTSWD
jgi:general secretion pathway protein G